MLVASLSNQEYRVTAVARCEEGIEKVKAEPVDLVIFDVKMPGIAGIDALRKMKTYSSDIAAIAISGSPDLGTTVESMRLGVFDYIAKPFELTEIFNAVERALDHQRRTRALVCAEETSRLQSELLLHMSHEFKTPIHTMQGHPKMLLQLVLDILT